MDCRFNWSLTGPQSSVRIVSSAVGLRDVPAFDRLVTINAVVASDATQRLRKILGDYKGPIASCCPYEGSLCGNCLSVRIPVTQGSTFELRAGWWLAAHSRWPQNGTCLTWFARIGAGCVRRCRRNQTLTSSKAFAATAGRGVRAATL